MKLGIAALALVLLASCKEQGSNESPAPAEVAKPQSGETVRVPPQFIGNWQFTREVCDAEFGGTPRKKLPQAFLEIQSDGTYFLTVEDFALPGTFKVDSLVDGPRLTLDGSALNFEAVNGTLENWSEGDAVYHCGRVFTKAR